MVYLASPFFKISQLAFVKKLEKAFSDNQIQFFSPRKEGILIDMTPEEKEHRMLDIFNSNISNMDMSDAIVAVIDDWDTGTVVEIGYSYAKEKPIFTISNNDYGLNIMVRQMVVAHNISIDNLLTNLFEYDEEKPLTVFNELTKDVT